MKKIFRNIYENFENTGDHTSFTNTNDHAYMMIDMSVDYHIHNSVNNYGNYQLINIKLRKKYSRK